MTSTKLEETIKALSDDVDNLTTDLGKANATIAALSSQARSEEQRGTEFLLKIEEVNELIEAGEPENITTKEYPAEEGVKVYYSYDSLSLKRALDKVFGVRGWSAVFDSKTKCCFLHFADINVTRFHFSTSDYNAPGYDQAFQKACFEFGIAPRASGRKLSGAKVVVKSEEASSTDLDGLLSRIKNKGINMSAFEQWVTSTYGVQSGKLNNYFTQDQAEHVEEKMRAIAKASKPNSEDLLKKLKIAWNNLDDKDKAKVKNKSRALGVQGQNSTTPDQARQLLEYIEGL